MFDTLNLAQKNVIRGRKRRLKIGNPRNLKKKETQIDNYDNDALQTLRQIND